MRVSSSRRYWEGSTAGWIGVRGHSVQVEQCDEESYILTDGEEEVEGDISENKGRFMRDEAILPLTSREGIRRGAMAADIGA